MREELYCVSDGYNILATRMPLAMALIFIKAYCEELNQIQASLTISQMDLENDKTYEYAFDVMVTKYCDATGDDVSRVRQDVIEDVHSGYIISDYENGYVTTCKSDDRKLGEDN